MDARSSHRTELPGKESDETDAGQEGAAPRERPHESRRRYRFGIEIYDGRAQLDTFFMFRERYAVVGMWLDL